MVVLNKLIFLLTPKERIQSYYIFFIILIMAFIEIAGLASIVPFIAILSDPEIIDKNSKLNAVFET